MLPSGTGLAPQPASSTTPTRLPCMGIRPVVQSLLGGSICKAIVCTVLSGTGCTGTKGISPWWERQSHAFNRSIPCGLARVGPGPGALPHQGTEPSHLAGLVTLCRHIIPCFRLSVGSFVLLKCVHHMTPGQPHCSICALWGGDRILLLQHKRGVCRSVFLHQLQEGPAGPGVQCWLGKLTLLCSLHVSRALFYPGLGCLAFLGDSDADMHGRSARTSTPGGWPRMMLLSNPPRCAVLVAVLGGGCVLKSQGEHAALVLCLLSPNTDHSSRQEMLSVAPAA